MDVIALILIVVVICKLLTRHDAIVTRKECHARLACNIPLDHLAVWFARVINKTCNCTPRRVDDHVIIEKHEVVALLVLVSPHLHALSG